MTSFASALSDDAADAYLDRIGVVVRPPATIEALAELQWRHLRSVPFENLSIHLGEPISLTTADLFDKVVTRRRGGFCYELNGLFAQLLSTLGFTVTLLGGGVYGPDGLGPPFDHLALLVDGYLVDVGFGRHSAGPLRADTDADQEDQCGVFRVATLANGDLDVHRNGEPQYRLETRPRALADFEPTCWWQQTHPGSHFRTGPVCSLLTDTAGLETLAGRRLIVTDGGSRTETPLTSDAEILATYRDRFGIILDRVPGPIAATETAA